MTDTIRPPAKDTRKLLLELSRRVARLEQLRARQRDALARITDDLRTAKRLMRDVLDGIAPDPPNLPLNDGGPIGDTPDAERELGGER